MMAAVIKRGEVGSGSRAPAGCKSQPQNRTYRVRNSRNGFEENEEKENKKSDQQEAKN